MRALPFVTAAVAGFVFAAPMLLSKAPCAAPASAEQTGYTSLFNGENLDGWTVKCKPQDAGKNYWRAEDGAIVCDTAGDKDHDYVWLMTDKAYDNFELELEVQSYADCPGNSGVQVRSRYDDEAQWLDGPQIDIHPPDPWRTGHLYDETRGVRHWICPELPSSAITPEQVNATHTWRHAGSEDAWNRIRIRCEGPRVQTWINGTPVIDYDGSGVLDDEVHEQHNVGMDGHIALQLHIRDDLKMRYRNVRLREL